MNSNGLLASLTNFFYQKTNENIVTYPKLKTHKKDTSVEGEKIGMGGKISADVIGNAVQLDNRIH
jgi:hypothetical protein